MNCCNSKQIEPIKININYYNIPEQERLNYLNNLRQQIKSYYSVNAFETAVLSNKLAYDQGGELLENWLYFLEYNYGKNPLTPVIL
jgi:hypothetical protein